MIFWDKVVKMDVYICNRTAVNPKINNSRITPYEDWRKKKPSINYFRVWGCKCYVYNNPKSLPAGTRQDKFMDYGKVGIFLGYSDRTDH